MLLFFFDNLKKTSFTIKLEFFRPISFEGLQISKEMPLKKLNKKSRKKKIFSKQKTKKTKHKNKMFN